MKKRFSIGPGALFLIIPFLLLLMFSCENGKKTKVAVLNYSPAAAASLQGFREGMTVLGYIECENISYDYSGPLDDAEKLDAEAERLKSLNPDLVFSMSTPATLAAIRVFSSSSVPVVFAPVSSPVQAGIVRDMVEHEENITGVTFGPQEPRRLEMLKQFYPDVKNIYVPYLSGDKSSILGVERLVDAADKLGIELILDPMESTGQLKERLGLFRKDMEAVFMPTDSSMVSMTTMIAEFCLANSLPFTCPQREGVEQGALFSYGFSIYEIGIQASNLADQILKGASPGELPVELAEFLLTLNMNTAVSIGLDVPDTVLAQASHIIR